MRILHLTPGTGSFHCGSCLRDHALIRALRSRGHDALMAPLYLPLVTDREATNPEIPVQAGGVSLYLQEKMPFMRYLPRFVHGWLNRPALLRLAGRWMGMTSAKDLGQMTLGALAGESGNQWSEWQRVLTWIKTEIKPDLISLSNGLLMGLCPVIQRDLGIPVIVSLQGEDSFLDTLIDPYREQCWAAMQANATHVSRFVTASRYYGDLMQKRLNIPAEKMSLAYNGLELTACAAAKPDPNWNTIGYFARMIHGKGLTTLVDAFILLNQRGKVPRLKLKIGGAKTASDEKYISGLRAKLKASGYDRHVEWQPNLSFGDKVKFFRDLTVMSVPATYGEAFGLYVIESIASGVPVVQPRHGAFPELIELTQGGSLCEPDDVPALADALETLLLDGKRREQMITIGMAKVRTEFSAARMAEQFDEAMQLALKK
ncbi:MAG: glycosyltransferase family 4 protein [Verrucomicrobia bacterium]|nr:glycosyltransferase family 4 protein [Verrucomicrobiota bacterium]